MSNLKVSISGVRGVVGESLTPPLVSAFAAAFGSYVGAGRIIVGRDTRPSGEMVEHAVVAGLLSVGCEPVLVGVTPTPTLLILVQELQAAGGICITASHNPAEWNALKFVGADGLFLNAIEASELLDVYHQENEAYAGETEMRAVDTLADPFAVHRRRILERVDVAAIRACRFRVAADLCNGVGVPTTRRFLEELGCEVVTLNDRADGAFGRAPEPTPESLGDLGAAVRAHGCVLGFAQDPDGDRLALVDGAGEPIGENYTLVLAAAHLLSRQAGDVVVNLATSKAVEDVTVAAGGRCYYTKIGEMHVTTELLRRRAVFGGEGNGGVIWPAVHPCRDSFAGMALILELLAARGGSLEAILAGLPRYYAQHVKLPCRPEQAQAVVRRLRQKFADREPQTLDGVRIDWEDRWVLVRPSNTEPVLRIVAEAPSVAAAAALAAAFQAEVEAAGGEAAT